ncbi:hypothetical protein D9Q98_000638 [Chlorella vulgaris]|uniref:MRH domain-containing protein n=1 Tax=Chlorella vulgaris TaxID=3077 RepID=A0A9D4TYH3_CHLVU|nr:hypothetical protein D9Q98_000638 [Chlorella vulgaris]
MTETVPNFVDSTDPNTAYVVGFKTEAGHQPPSQLHRTMLMRSPNGTSFRCYIPDPAASAQAAEGSSIAAAENSLFPQKKPSELLEALAGHCYYRIEEWWTYELCFKQKLRQYHKDDGRTVSQYLMGSYAAGGEQEDEVQLDSSDVAGPMRYVSQQYTEGEACELTGQPRQAEVRFTCGTGEDTLLTSVKELASCHYLATVTTPRLCKHPAFQEQPQPAALIQCHPLSPSEAEAATAAAAQSSGTGHCASGAQQRPDGSCASSEGVSQGSSEGQDTASVAQNTTWPDHGAVDDAAEEDGSLLQALVEGQENAAYDDDGEGDPNDPYE